VTEPAKRVVIDCCNGQWGIQSSADFFGWMSQLFFDWMSRLDELVG
jgi:hypothetical protein